mgnify:CR=1 FL=1
MQFSGKKTYLTSIAIAAVQFAPVMGWLTQEEAQTTTNVLIGGAAAFLRMAITKK